MSDIVIAVLTICCGCIICFSGYRFFRLSLALIGAAIGFIAGSMVADKLAPLFAPNEKIATLITVILFAAIFGGLAFWLYLKVLIVAATLYIGWWVYSDYRSVVMEAEAGKQIAALLIGLAAGALIGIAVYYMQKWTISLFTALVGARIISSVITPILYTQFLSGEAAQNIEQLALGTSFTGSMVQAGAVVVLIFTVFGFAHQVNIKDKK
ncbi:MAG: TMEM198/TM7SF3 family protein [Saccharofermentans sp.]|nr:TMEM198/TM7SF3 family protein [Saccharofermentans sp.]